MKNYHEMSVKELKEIAKNLKVANWWNLNKMTLIEKIEEKEEEEKLLDHYGKNWMKYGVRHDPIDFLNKVKSGKIILKDEEDHGESEVKEDQQPEVKTTTTPATTAAAPKRGALIEYNGKSQNLCAWAKELGISPNTLYGRIYKMGWPIEKAFQNIPGRDSTGSKK